MAFYHLVGMFRPDADAHRAELQGQWNEHMAQHRPRVHLAGPLFDEAGRRVGVMILIEAETQAEACSFLDHSPYREAGLYEAIYVHELRNEVGRIG